MSFLFLFSWQRVLSSLDLFSFLCLVHAAVALRFITYTYRRAFIYFVLPCPSFPGVGARLQNEHPRNGASDIQ